MVLHGKNMFIQYIIFQTLRCHYVICNLLANNFFLLLLFFLSTAISLRPPAFLFVVVFVTVEKLRNTCTVHVIALGKNDAGVEEMKSSSNAVRIFDN